MTRLEVALRRGEDISLEMQTQLLRLTQTSEPQNQLLMITDAYETSLAEYRTVLKGMAYNDLTAFAEYINPDEPPAPHHIWMCERLMEIESGEILRLLLSMPPGHAKSTYASRLFPAWYMGRNPKHRFIQAGHTQGFCENEFGKKTKAIIDSADFRDIFPEVSLSSDSKAAGYWTLAGFGGSYLTRGVGQGIAGFRAHIAGVDDPFATREDAESQTIRDKVYDWFSADFTTRLLPFRPMYVVATRWHSDDLCGRLEEMTKEGVGIPWYVINLPAIAEGEDDPLKRPSGEALWPDFYTIESLENLKATLPPRDWNSLYMGKPIDSIGGILTQDSFKFYKSLPEKDNIRRTVLSVDSAIKDNERADYTALGIWIEDGDRNHYLKRVIRRKVEFPQLVQLIEATARAHDVDAILIEDKGSGTQYIQTRGGKAPAPVIGVSPNNNTKEFRFDAVIPAFEAGTVLVPERSEWLAEYMQELIAFPNGKYDDQVDMTSQYLSWARVKVKRGPKKLHGMGAAPTGINDPKIVESIKRGMEDILKKSMEDPIAKQLREQGYTQPLPGDPTELTKG